ncbi:response regulator transcription factor [Nonomuraea pusilla]|uniref:response regulator n=1 Tax=Nonomuraea pusilla TaxID=46177 RepID=UPI0033252E76
MSVNIVVVDDDPGFRRVARALLTARGLRVVAESPDGASAIAAVREHHPDGVLLDLHLPGEDGLSVARAITGQGHPLRIVMTSTDRWLWSEEELAGTGIVRFVPKDRLFDTDLKALFSATA